MVLFHIPNFCLFSKFAILQCRIHLRPNVERWNILNAYIIFKNVRSWKRIFDRLRSIQTNGMILFYVSIITIMKYFMNWKLFGNYSKNSFAKHVSIKKAGFSRIFWRAITFSFNFSHFIRLQNITFISLDLETIPAITNQIFLKKPFLNVSNHTILHYSLRVKVPQEILKFRSSIQSFLSRIEKELEEGEGQTSTLFQ